MILENNEMVASTTNNNNNNNRMLQQDNLSVQGTRYTVMIRVTRNKCFYLNFQCWRYRNCWQKLNYSGHLVSSGSCGSAGVVCVTVHYAKVSCMKRYASQHETLSASASPMRLRGR